MKKFAASLLILLLLAICVPALAATDADGLGNTVTRNAELAAFLDGNGNIYISGLEKPVNTTAAESLVSIDPYRILFFARANSAAGVAEGRLISLALDGFRETVVTDDAYAACLDEENVYYISRADRTLLICCNLDSGESRVAFTAAESLDRIYDSSIGIITTLVDGAGSYISDPLTGQFIPYGGDAARELAQGDGFEAYLTDNANLNVRLNGAFSTVLVDTSVRAWTIIGHSIYYLSGNEGSLELKQYNVDANLWTWVLTLPANMKPQLTASENSLFVLSSDNRIYSVDVGNGRLVDYAALPGTQSYALGGSRTLVGFRIEAVSGQLNVYGEVEDSSLQPVFTFTNFGGAPSAGDTSDVLLLSAYPIEAESTVYDLLQPAPQYSPLRRGSRGEAVSVIQQPLYDLGYYNYYIDGIFGWRTERAVELLQDALGLPVTGIADEALQHRILEGNLPAYDPYRVLMSGDRGLRVTEMQQRLRDLGYLADDADGVFGPRTMAAVELFQEENDLPVNGIATAETLRKLFSGSARTCSSYIELRWGDSGYRVRELNRRLKELYYLEGSVGSTYTSATAEAVRLFQQEVGLRQTGVATVEVQRRLFARNAPEYSGYITLRRGDDNDRVLAMQRRLRKLGYYDGALDGYFGKETYQAVRAFQRQAGLRVTGVADPVTLRRLFANDAPEYEPPTELTKPIIDFYGASFDADENGVYLVPAETKHLDFFWSAKGVASYDITLRGNDEIITSQRNTTDEMVGVNTSRLLQDVIYKFTVVAHPQDKVNNKDTKAELLFRIVPKPPTLSEVTIHVDSDSYSITEGVYEINRDSLKFSWEADGGEVSRYEFELTDDGGKSYASGDNGTSLDATSYELPPDIIYTLTVNAYPVNNDAGMVSAQLRFRVVDPESLATPEPTPTAEPSPEVSTEPSPEASAETSVEPSVSPDTSEDPTAAETPEASPAADASVTPEASPAADASVTPEASPAADATVTPEGSPATEAPATPEAPMGVVTTTLPEPQQGGESGGTPVDGGTGEQPGVAPGGQDAPSIEAQTGDGISEGPSTGAQADDGVAEGPSIGEPGQGDGELPQAQPIGIPAVGVEPAVDEVSMEVVTPAGGTSTENVVLVGEGTIQLHWAAEGDIAGYNVRITDEAGNTMVDQNLTDTGANISSDNLQVNEVYTMVATAYANSGETTSAMLYFMKYAEAPQASGETAEAPENANGAGADVPHNEAVTDVPDDDEPEYEDAAPESTPAPVSVEPLPESTREPAYEEPTYEEPAYEEPTYEEPTYEEPTYEEPTYEEPTQEPEYAETIPQTEPVEIDPGDEFAEPTEKPAQGKTDSKPKIKKPMDDPSAWTKPVKADSAPGDIAAVQLRLCEWGWLEEGSYKEGKLDKVTVQAVIKFQKYCNENGMDLKLTKKKEPVIRKPTLHLLFNADGEVYENPESGLY